MCFWDIVGSLENPFVRSSGFARPSLIKRSFKVRFFPPYDFGSLGSSLLLGARFLRITLSAGTTVISFLSLILGRYYPRF